MGRAGRMAKAPVLKTGGRKPLQRRILCAPPLRVAECNLKRVVAASTTPGPIPAAVFLFADSTAPELARSLKFGPTPPGAPDPGGAIGSALDFIVDGRSHSADESFRTALL